LGVLPASFFTQESSIILCIDGFLASEKVQVKDTFESQNIVAMIIPAETIGFTFSWGLRMGVSTAYLLF
jgi:hypothetical protein